MEKEYISIREFAARANISRQGAYKIVSKKLQSYCKIIGNKKYIDISALGELTKVGDKSCRLGDKIVYKECLLGNKTIDSCLQQGSQFVDNYKFQPGDRNCQLEDKSVDKMVDILNEQLKIKDKQLEIKDKQISELTEMLKDIQAKQNELMCSLKAAQALHAGTIQEHIESKVEKESKRGFWNWLFRKRH